MPDRRELLEQALILAAGAPALLAAAGAAAQPAVGPSLRILILGGTGFIGPHHVRYAVARGHKVSVFNRGKRQAELPASVEHLTGDRNGDISAITGRDWDAVIDLPTTLPNWVRTVGQAVAARTKHYSFISSLAVYDNARQAALLDEDSPLREYKDAADPFSLTSFGLDLYGPLKTLSEREAERQFPRKTLIVRPGLIVGPGDETDRFTYWPVRMQRGGEVLAPGDPLDPAQIIDVRDLAEFVIHMAERRETGAYNANGPAMPMSICEMLGGVRSLYSVPTKLTWAPGDWLAAQGVTMGDLPVWYPQAAALANRADVRRAVAKGMTFRPLAVTTRETMAWHEARPGAPRTLRGGLTPAREQELLAALRNRPA